MRSLIAVAVLVAAFAGGCKKAAPKPSEKQPEPPVVGGPRVPAPPLNTGPQVTAKDMEDVRIFIDNASGASGRMPSPQMVAEALKQPGSPVADMVQNGAIVIPPARTREEVWAYEAKAIEQGGFIVGVNGVEQVSAAEAKRRLGK